MLKKYIKRYYSKTFEERIEFSSIFSFFINLVTALGKIIIGLISASFFFLLSAGINICLGFAKKECYVGIKRNIKEEKFNKVNLKVALLVMLAGLMYILYMGRLVLLDLEKPEYDMFIAICIATVSFVELTFAIIGIVKVKYSGHFYRNIKIINLSSACNAIVSTQIALLAFMNSTNANFYNGLFGIGVGIFTIILGLFILILPKISMVEKIHNEYKYNNSKDLTIEKIKNYNGKYKIIVENDNRLTIIFSNNKVYGKYYFDAQIDDGGIIGDLKYTNSFFRNLHIVWKIIIIILSEILIFVWLIGKFIDFIINTNLPKKLTRLMVNFDAYKNNND